MLNSISLTVDRDLSRISNIRPLHSMSSNQITMNAQKIQVFKVNVSITVVNHKQNGL